MAYIMALIQNSLGKKDIKLITKTSNQIATMRFKPVSFRIRAKVLH